MRGRLIAMQPGEVIKFSDVRGSTLRNTASVLRELNRQYKINAVNKEFYITCIQ